ncbi:MAG: FAD-linked oxidase, partial [Bdellovibrionales bacterium GWC1_52_8]
GEVVISLSKMNKMGPVDTMAQTVRVQAGAITELVHKHCEPHSLTWPVDFGSKGSSEVGGNIATNAGGVKVIRYGNTRNWVLGLQVVTMAGDILELNGSLEKNNTGPDLKQLFIGSEGILGIITEATLKLVTLPKELQVLFFAVEDMSAVLKLFHEVRKSPFAVMAFETMTHNCIEAVTAELGLKNPLATTASTYVLMEIEQPVTEKGREVLDSWLEKIFESGLVLDGTLAQSPREARDLWSIRESINECLAHRAFVHKNDVAVPVAELEPFVASMHALFETKHGTFEIAMWGHIGDGNLHINTLKPEAMDKGLFIEKCHEADQELFALIQKHRGTISAEHGVGLLKKAALHFTRTPAELVLLRGIKKVFDPAGLMNPGKVF